jgi:(p)ppGpp synthase/HD superfamily hydrolase
MLKEKVIQAYNFAKKAHHGQFRKYISIEYFVHSKAVARFVEQISKKEDLVITALLHDVIEDTEYGFTDIKDLFGKTVANYVLELTNDKTKIKKLGKKEYMANKCYKMTNEVLIVKLADRLHNVFFLEEDKVPIEYVEKCWNNTHYVLERIKTRNDLLVEHKVLIKKIEAVLEFLEIRYKFIKEENKKYKSNSRW